MSKNNFTFVNTPHDPISISGSDPHSSHSDANLAVWYKVQEDHMIYTGSTDANDLPYIHSLHDQSLNGGKRTLNKGTSNIPVLATETTADGIRYIEGSVTYSRRPMYLRSASTGSAQHMNSESSTWIKGPTTDQTDDAPATSLFVVLKNDTNYTSAGSPLTFTFGAHNDGDTGINGESSTFSLGIDTEADRDSLLCLGYDSVNSTATVRYGMPEDGTKDQTSFRCLSLVYSSGSHDERSLRMYHSGISYYHLTTSGSRGEETTGIRPGHHGTLKLVMLGGSTYNNGGGYTTSTTQKPAFAESFVFEDGLSDIRRQQMESYICDKYDLKLSSSSHLSIVENGGQGIALLTGSLSSPAAGIQTATKVARKFVTAASSNNDIHHETVAGAFIRSSVSGSAFYGITGSSDASVSSSLGISQRMWVRAESIDDANHGGSHVALITKAASPFGHQMDNIKGYALKFGTFKDGADTDSLKFRLSTRGATSTTDGNHSGFTDQDLTPTNFTPVVDKWYQMRLDVLRAGSVAKAHTPSRTANVVNIGADNAVLNAGSGSAWENLFGASSATSGNQTWSIWIKTSDFTNEWMRPMIIGGYNNEEHGIELQGSTGRLAWHAWYGGSRKDWVWNSVFTTAKQDGNWHHILITSKMASTWSNSVIPELWFDGEKQTLTSDGSPAGGSTITQFDDAGWNWDHLSIGGDGEPDESIYPSRISNAAIWNKLLTDSEVAEVYNSGKITDTSTSDVAPANIVGHWKMDDSSGSPIVVQDETSNNNDATASNTNVTIVSDTNLAAPTIAASSDGVDTIKVFARGNGGDKWESLATTSISNTADNFRYWKDDSGFDTSKTGAPTGIHNGYYIAMSSSTGQKLSTTYYIDNYSVQTSGSNTIDT